MNVRVGALYDAIVWLWAVRTVNKPILVVLSEDITTLIRDKGSIELISPVNSVRAKKANDRHNKHEIQDREWRDRTTCPLQSTEPGDAEHGRSKQEDQRRQHEVEGFETVRPFANS